MKKQPVIQIDGSRGEGGGQVLRTSLALSICLGKPFEIHHIRAGRARPGLLRQHLTAVKAAASISNAHVQGDSLKSQHLVFEPAEVQSGEYHFAIGTAGSTTLVLQTILMPLLLAQGASKVVIEGGTHNPLAPTVDFLQQAYLPLLQRMGGEVKVKLIRPGFFPAGGGRLEVDIQPAGQLRGIDLLHRGALLDQSVRVYFAGLPFHIVEREMKVLQKKLNWPQSCFSVHQFGDCIGSGNVISVCIKSENVCEVFTGFGEKGVKAERVANRVVTDVRRYLGGTAVLDEHLSDQVLLPLALAGRGQFLTAVLSQHTLTNIEVIRHFIDIAIETQKRDDGCHHVKLGA